MNTFRQTVVRHDFDARHPDPVGRLRAVLDTRTRRSDRGAGEPGEAADPIHGLLKRGLMAAQHGDAWQVMGAIKAALDPCGILNPRKLVPDRN